MVQTRDRLAERLEIELSRDPEFVDYGDVIDCLLNELGDPDTAMLTTAGDLGDGLELTRDQVIALFQGMLWTIVNPTSPTIKPVRRLA